MVCNKLVSFKTVPSDSVILQLTNYVKQKKDIFDWGDQLNGEPVELGDRLTEGTS